MSKQVDLSKRKRLPRIPHRRDTKLCSACRKWVKLALFSHDKAAWDGLRPECKGCANEKRRTAARKRGVPAFDDLRTPTNKSGERWCKFCQQWKAVKQFSKDKAKWDGRRTRCKRCDAADRKQYRDSLPADVKAARARKRYAWNIQYRLRMNLHNRLWWALNGIVKSVGTMELLDCTIEEFRAHLEAGFEPGMTWDNHTLHGWHIGHIKDCCSFDLTDPVQQRECFHYTNLHPEWSQDNWRKPRGS